MVWPNPPSMPASSQIPPSPATRAFATPVCVLLAILAGAILLEIERQREYDEKLWGGYGTPIKVTAIDAHGNPAHLVLAESTIDSSVVRWQEKWTRYWIWWSGAAKRVLQDPLGSLENR